MRDVDSSWPRAGSRLHHSIGAWPLLLNDSTTVREWDPPHRMALTARGWPLGEAHVEITATRLGDECLVRIREVPATGPATWVPRSVANLVLRWRNAETLKRLAYLAEGRERRTRRAVN